MIIGILGMQGNLEEHIAATIAAMESLGIKGGVSIVRDKEELARTDGLIISGGESTTMWKLLRKTGMFNELEKYRKPVFGTCAGMILLAKEGSSAGKRDAEKTGQEFLGKMDAVVDRNAFGRQKESFSVDLGFNGLSDPARPFHAVFIRAPAIESVGKGVEVLAKYSDRIVAARQGNVLVTAFHPELTNDTRVHEYFLRMV